MAILVAITHSLLHSSGQIVPLPRGTRGVLIREDIAMKYLDYYRLQTCDDPALRTFLLSICETDTVRRVQATFPEYFTDDPNEYNYNVFVRDILVRMDALANHEDYELDEFDRREEAFSWLGIKIDCFEYRTDGEKRGEYEILPNDFVLKRNEDYDGFRDEDPWFATLSVSGGQPEEHLVLAILVCDDEVTKYFIWTVPTRRLVFEEASSE